MPHSLSTNLKPLPGRVRLVLLFALVIPLVILPFTISAMDLDDVYDVLIGWAAMFAASAILGYLVTAFVSMVLWVQDGFEIATRTRATRVLARAGRFAIILAACALLAAYTRYDVVALVDKSGRGYHYLVWDRWSGETYLEYGSRESSRGKHEYW